MADKHPYISATGPLFQTLEQFRKALPVSITSETLKKLGLAPGNESFIINILKFLALVQGDGTRTPEAQAAFTKHDDKDFAASFESFVRKAYKDLFALHNDATWDLSSDRLIAFFRTTDQTSDLVGRRQAMTFKALASMSGHGAITPKDKSAPKNAAVAKAPRTAKSSNVVAPAVAGAARTPSGGGGSPVGLTVRIEINLPAQGDQDTYDRIFTSLRKNLLNG
jgi:hypothetical protein